MNYDQFCAGDELLDQWYNSHWESSLYNSGLTERDLELWQQRRSFDRECTVEEELAALAESGFKTAECIYSCRKFAVIAAIK